MLSYDPPMPANKGHKDTPNVLTVTNGAVTTLPPSSKPNGSAAMSTTTSIPQKHHHIWLVTGPAGCGKTTIAEFLASQLNLPYIEGDAV